MAHNDSNGDGMGVFSTIGGKYLGELLCIYPEFWLYMRPDGVTLAMLSSAEEIKDGKD